MSATESDGFQRHTRLVAASGLTNRSGENVFEIIEGNMFVAHDGWLWTKASEMGTRERRRVQRHLTRAASTVLQSLSRLSWLQ